MVIQTLKHNQGKNGSHWVNLMRQGKADRILIVAIDIGKYTHKTLMTNVFQDVIVAPFEMDASMTGFGLLVKKIEEACRCHNFDEVVVGIETTAHYYEDLVRLCYEKGYSVTVINAATTAFEREALLNWSKTDNLDLAAIVHSILQGRGNPAIQMAQEIETLKKLTRFRRTLVGKLTTLKNQMYALLDTIFRELQGKSTKVNGERVYLKPFSTLDTKAALHIIRHYPHPTDILGLGEEGLYKLSREHNLKLRKGTVDCLLEFARDSISKPKECLEGELFQLNMVLDSRELLEKQIKESESKIEDIFLQTDGAILLTIPGMGVVTAAELRAEMGQLDQFKSAKQLIKMAGTNPIVKQSGGHKATYGAISKQGRREFRCIVFLIGQICSSVNEDMRTHYVALKDKGKKTRQAYIAIGNRLLRVAFAMIRDGKPYQSKSPGYSLTAQINNKITSKEMRQQFYEKHNL